MPNDPSPSFDLTQHLFYMKVIEFFHRTRQAHWTRSQIIARLEKLQDEVKPLLAAERLSIEEQYEALHPHVPVEGR